MNQRHAGAEAIQSGRAILGIELGSTRIKASLIAPDTTPLASGSHAWENQLKDGVWTYDMEDVWKGLAACYASLVDDVRARYSLELDDRRGHGRQRDDARLRGPRRRGTAPRAVPNLAQQHHRPGLRRADARCSTSPCRSAGASPTSTSRSWRSSRTCRGSPTSPRSPATSTGSLTGEHAVGVGEASGMFPIDPRTDDWDAARMASASTA